MIITLKDISSSDLEMIRCWRNSERVSRFMYTSKYITKEEQIKWFESLKNKQDIYKIFSYKSNPVGLVCITDMDFDSLHCQWGIYIGNENFLSSGIGIFASLKILEKAFEDLKFNKVTSMVLDYNTGAIKLNNSLGFKKYGTYEQHCKKDDIFHDMIGFSLTREVWNIKSIEIKNKLKL